MTVVVIGEMRFPPANLAAVKPHFESLVLATRRLDGCIAYEVAEALFEPGLIRFSELWPDRPSLMAHLQAPHIEPWRKEAARFGVSDRRFSAFEAGDRWSV